MASINGIHSAYPPSLLGRTAPAAPAAPASPGAPADRVELSGVQSFLSTLKSNDVRTDKVAEIKAAIEAGTYESDDKLDVAIDRLLDDLV